MAWMIPAAIVGSSIIGGLSSQSAADTAASAANRSADTQAQIFSTVNEQNAPWRKAGEIALSDIADMKGYFTHPFSASDINDNLPPNWRFSLDQGIGAVKNAGNLQTGLLSGNTLKAISDYTLAKSGDLYQNAFANYTANQQNIFNRLSTIAGYGSSSNQTVAGAAAPISAGIGNSQIASGAASAAGTMGMGNAISGGINSAAGWYSLPQIMSMSRGGGTISGGSSGASLPVDYMSNVG